MSAVSNKDSKGKPSLRRIKPLHWFVIVVVFALSLVPLTPNLIGFIIKHVAENQGYVLKYRETMLNPTEGRLEYQDLEVITNNKTLFTCGHCMATIDVGEAIDDRYIIRQAVISDAKFYYDALPQSQEQTETSIPYWQIDDLSIIKTDILGIPELDKRTVSISELTLTNLNRDSTEPGRTRIDVGFGSSRLLISSQITTSPYPDFETLEVSLKDFDYKLIPAEYRLIKGDVSGILDIKATAYWEKKADNSRILVLRDAEYRVRDGGILQEGSGIHSLNTRIVGNVRNVINTGQLPERLVYEQVSYQGNITLSGNLTDGASADRPIILENVQADITALLDTDGKSGTRITSDVKIPLLDHTLPGNIQVTGSASWNGDTHIQTQRQDGSTLLATHTGKLAGTLNIEPDQDKGLPAIKLDSLEFNGKLKLERKDLEPVNLQITGDTTLGKLTVEQIPGRPDLLLTMDNPEVQQLSMNITPLTITLGKITSSKIVLGQNEIDGNLPIDDVAVSDFSLKDDNLSIKSVSLGKFDMNIERTASGEIQIMPPALLSQEGPAESKEDKSTEPELTLAIDSVTIGKDSKITFTDQSVKPEFSTQASFEHASIMQLSSQGEKPMTFDLAGKVGQRGNFKAEGKTEKHKDSFDIEAASKLTGLSLGQLSQYTGELIGYQMDKGHMDLKIDGTVKDKQLSGQSKLLITGLKVTPLNNETQKQFDKSVGLSLTSAISMLEDNKGHIDLTVPISGDIDNPDFGMGDVISKALDEGLKAGLLVAFQPIGLAVIAVDAMAKLGGIPLGEIDFESGSAELDSVDAERLTLLAEKMQEKPGTRLKVCAIALENELPPGSLLKKSKGDTDQQVRKAIDPEFTRNLAAQRLKVIRNFLIEHKVEENRFEECAPEVVSPENNKPSATLILADIAKSTS